MRVLRSSLIVALIVTGLLGRSPATAATSDAEDGRTAAGSTTVVRPDLLISSGSRPPVGDDVYNADGSATEQFDVFGCPSEAPHEGWSVSYFDGTTDVSQDMVTGHGVTLGPGATKALTLNMQIRREGLKRARSCSTQVTASSFSVVTDVVEARVRRR